MEKDKILAGYKKSRVLIRDAGPEIEVKVDRTITWGKVEFDLKKGWKMPNLDDETLAKIMHMENITFKKYAEKVITWAEIDAITSEVFGNE